MSSVFTPSRRNVEDDESSLGSYYRLKSFKKLMEKNRKSSSRLEHQKLDDNAIYTTPVRSSCRINSNKRIIDEDKIEFDLSENDLSKKILVTPNPYIQSNVVEDLLNDLLTRYKDKIQIISFNKQPQIECRDENEIENKLNEDLDNLGEELNKKLNICNENNINKNDNYDDENKNNVDDNDLNNDNNGNLINLDSSESSLNSSSKRKKYFVCRNKPRVLIGIKDQSTDKEYEIIAENEYWMVVEFLKGSKLGKKYNCSRILTPKKILGNPIKYPKIQSVEEYKVLHSELKKLLKLSNYFYSPDLF